MALYINRWTRPLHVYDAPVISEALPGRSSCAYDLHPDHEALCGVSLEDANDRPASKQEKASHGLRVSEMEQWEGLDEFLRDERLCDECRERLPEAWPPAARVLQEAER